MTSPGNTCWNRDFRVSSVSPRFAHTPPTRSADPPSWVVAAWRLRPASLHYGDPTAAGVGGVVETKELPRTPTNQRASDLIDHGLGLDVAHWEHRGNKKKESIAAFLGLEVSGSPRKEFGQRAGLWLTVHKKALGWRLQSRLPHARKEEGGLVRGTRCPTLA